MTWVRLDDRFPEHPKVAAVGPLELALHVSALAYAGRNLTDGYLPAQIVVRLVDLDRVAVLHDSDRLTPVWERAVHRDLAGRLVNVGLWEEAPEGFQIHDYLDYNPSRQEVEADRDAIAAARSLGGEKGGKTRAAIGPRDDRGRYVGGDRTPTEPQVSPHKPTLPPHPEPDPNPEPRKSTALPTAATAEPVNPNGNGHGPSHDALWLASRINERWNVSRSGRLTPAGIQRLCSEHGASAVESALRELHGFPPSEAVRKPFAYLRAALENRRAEVAP